MKLVRRTFVAAAVAALLPVVAQAADIREHAIKFAFQNPKEHPQGQGAQKLADLVAQKSGGKMQVKLYASGQLGGDVQTVSALQGGTIEMTVLNAGILQSQVKEFAVYDFPFLFNSAQEADAVTDGVFGKNLFAKLEPKGLVGLNYWDLGFRNLTNSKRPINKADDITGLKIRVIQSPIYVDIFNALGANATPMPFPEVYPALEQKAIDGHENPATVIKANKIYDVQKYLALTRHIYNPQALIVSRKFWDKLNADERAVITEAAAQATTYQRGVSRTQADIAVDDLRKAGMQVTELPPAEIAKLRDKVKPVIEKQTAIVGADTVAALQSELAKLRK